MWCRAVGYPPTGYPLHRSSARKSADKPGSVVDSHSSGTCVTAYLKRPTRKQHGPCLAGHPLQSAELLPYLVLLRVGFALPPLLPVARCALTAPFHPYRHSRGNCWRYIFCGTFRRLSPPRRYLALCPMEPGLSSTHQTMSSDCLANSRAGES
jgi:hypothetical protein